MDLMEIDIKQYITCRLCLEDTGVYPIVPTVLHQIKYCFDIDIEPFDGLSQLLCKKCHTLLNEYSNVKKIFCEKQALLKEKQSLEKEEPSVNSTSTIEEEIEHNITAQNEAAVQSADNVTAQTKADSKANETEYSEVNSTVPIEDTGNSHSTLTKKFTKSKRRKRILSSSSNDSFNSNTTSLNSKKSQKNKKSKKWKNWKKKYTKYFVCKICSLMYKDKRSIKCHYYAHTDIKSSYTDIFDIKCSVNLTKLDNKPNITGVDNTVVLSKNRIIEGTKSPLHYILYIAKGKEHNKSDSSDDSEIVVSKKQRKICRLDSLSSNETVCLGDNNKIPETDIKANSNTSKPHNFPNNVHVNQDTVCIDIDDSSDSNMDTERATKPMKTYDLKVDLKTIENIITVCRNKYEIRLRKSQVSENDNNKAQMDSQLKHKILSFGRKSVNVRGLNSTGLLRYLEHKNLNVIWEPISQKKVASREHSFVRIGVVMNQVMRFNDDSGWIDVAGPTIDKESSNTLNQCTPIVLTTPILNVIPTAASIAIAQSKNISQMIFTDLRTSMEESNSKKLLNQSPVANPKQFLPKKTSYPHDTKPILVTRLNNSHEKKSLSQSENIIEENIVMPVITSTKSLAAEVYNEIKKNDPEISNAGNNAIIEKSAPRIKVKPVSELMAPEKNLIDQHNTVWNFGQMQNGTSANLIVPNTLVSQIQTQSTPILPVTAAPAVDAAVEPKSCHDYIILDTVDLPNTKTESPFEYFRNLLFLHELLLIDANSVISREFTCLLKFKVQFKQENKSNPVTLCLSLHCAGNRFSMSIKDGNQINIHIAKMSANWQWEIMKVYQGDVSNKILHNAQRAGPSIYTNTNTFLCLLKSINQKQEE